MTVTDRSADMVTAHEEAVPVQPPPDHDDTNQPEVSETFSVTTVESAKVDVHVPVAEVHELMPETSEFTVPPVPTTVTVRFFGGSGMSS